jgi:hypothetical protein
VFGCNADPIRKENAENANSEPLAEEPGGLECLVRVGGSQVGDCSKCNIEKFFDYFGFSELHL